MKILNLLVLFIGLMSFTSCSHLGGKKSCCKTDKTMTCKDGQCKRDKSKSSCKSSDCSKSDKKAKACSSGSCERTAKSSGKSCCNKTKS